MNSYYELAVIYKAMSDENRLRILNMLKTGEMCACRILDELCVTQPTLSHHLKVLCDSEIVEGRREGKWMHYSITEKGHEFTDCLFRHLQTEESDAQLLPPDLKSRTRLYVLTGFLGSGKTTILLKILEQLKGKRVGIIQNEFGKLGIDGTILRNDDIQMVEINKGSIFCSCLKLSFVNALAEMAKQEFDYLFVESSGLGDPSNVLEILNAASTLTGNAYDFCGAVCLVDCVNFLEQLSDLETVYRQLKHCHMAVLTKVDLVDPDHIDLLHRKIREINPVCRIALSSQGNLNMKFLNDDLMQYQWAESEDTTNIPEAKPKSLFLNYEGTVRREQLDAFLNDLVSDVYRMKGFFLLEESGWNQVDVVGSQIDYKSCEPQDRSQLVFISKIGPELIRRIFSAWNTHIGKPMDLKN